MQTLFIGLTLAFAFHFGLRKPPHLCVDQRDGLIQLPVGDRVIAALQVGLRL